MQRDTFRRFNPVGHFQTATQMQGPYHPHGTDRMNAILATNHAPYGTVGYGVNAAITGIFTGAHTAGQTHIGTVFGAPNTQHLLQQPNTWANNRAVAQVEHTYWRGVRDNPNERFGNRFAATFATMFTPGMRAGIQMTFGEARRMWNNH
ncbi:hypothetical protein [Gallaecimonas pentaromativorans]|uniref:hypothetical protein n=1 Tax=Gallaecimonas pentaromativorans TaxID=584787 RepID=UPI003A94210B